MTIISTIILIYLMVTVLFSYIQDIYDPFDTKNESLKTRFIIVLAFPILLILGLIDSIIWAFRCAIIAIRKKINGA